MKGSARVTVYFIFCHLLSFNVIIPLESEVVMSSMNVSLPDQMKNWVEDLIGAGQYHNASEYVRDLIRKDQADYDNRQAFRAAIDHGRTSGTESRDFKDVIKAAKAKAQKAK